MIPQDHDVLVMRAIVAYNRKTGTQASRMGSYVDEERRVVVLTNIWGVIGEYRILRNGKLRFID
jgi:hypothetical protein